MARKIEFGFRVWVHPEDGDPPEIEVWYPALEQTVVGQSLVTDWAQESMSYEDFHSIFALDSTKHWQVVGRAEIRAGHDLWGEYDEELIVLEFEVEEVPEEWGYSGLTLDRGGEGNPVTQHTPGPWEWHEDRLWGGKSGLYDSDGEPVCVPNCSNDGDTGHAWFEEMLTEPDAALIAAAPDLLHALQLVKSFSSSGETDNGESVSFFVEEAIRKATSPSA